MERSLDSSVGNCDCTESRNRRSIPGRRNIFLFSATSRPTQRPVQLIPEDRSLGTKWRGREPNHSPLSGAEGTALPLRRVNCTFIFEFDVFLTVHHSIDFSKYQLNTQFIYSSTIYRVSQEEWTKLRESVPYVKLYRYNPKHLYPKLNGYGDNGQRSLKV